MKTFKQSHRGSLAAAIISTVLMLAGTSPSLANGRYYRHDEHGYWDGHRRYHSFAYYHDHRGYWDERNGVRIFINL